MNSILLKLIGAILGIVVVLVILAAFSLIGAIPLYFLWNWLMPEIFAVKVVTFMQAWGMLFLTSILFKNNTSASK